jgi:hypothetical protein
MALCERGRGMEANTVRRKKGLASSNSFPLPEVPMYDYKYSNMSTSREKQERGKQMCFFIFFMTS